MDTKMEDLFKPSKKFLDNFDPTVNVSLAFEEVQKIIQNTLTPLEEYNQQVQYLNYLHNDTKLKSEGAALSTEVWQRALKAADADLKSATQSGQQFAVAIGNVVAQFGDRFFDTFAEGLKTGKFAFKDFIASALEDLAKLIFKLTITIPLAQGLTNLLGGGHGKQGQVKGAAVSAGASGIGSVITNGIGKIFGFADGGMVPGGSPVLVGERGPELFYPGKNGGYMQPNHQLGGGNTVNQYITIQTIDNRDFEDRLYENAKVIGNMSVQAIQKQENRMGRRGPMDSGRG